MTATCAEKDYEEYKDDQKMLKDFAVTCDEERRIS
jgi:hypothetical protein